MQREARKYLSDIQQAVTLLAEFTAGKQFSDYKGDAMLRAALVESCWPTIARERKWLNAVSSRRGNETGPIALMASKSGNEIREAMSRM